MSNFLRGSIPDDLLEMIEEHQQLDNALNELVPLLYDESSSSEEEIQVPRPMFDRPYSGHQYVIDVMGGHPIRSYNCFRLPPEAFQQIRELLVCRNLLCDTRNITAAEQLGIFLRAVAHAHSYRQVCEFFQHSLETVSRYFNVVLRAIVSLRREFIQVPTCGSATHPIVQGNSLFYPFFQNALGAIDGTHIPAVVTKDLQNRYRNRKGFTSQNVMAAVSFDRQFTFVASGWEGSAADMRVLRWAFEEGGFRVPPGQYYLVDSGYANTDKILAPFRGYRYHLSDYRSDTQRRYTVQQELFNHRHAQLRNVVERTFGIWKERFQILCRMRQFPLAVQGDIVIACAILHNFIGRHHGHDIYFNMSQTEMLHDSQLGEASVIEEQTSEQAVIGERTQGDALRTSIAANMWEAHGLNARRRSG